MHWRLTRRVVDRHILSVDNSSRYDTAPFHPLSNHGFTTLLVIMRLFECFTIDNFVVIPDLRVYRQLSRYHSGKLEKQECPT